MEYRFLGNTGLRVSEICLGTMQFGWTADESTSYLILDAAFADGVNFIDTADVYSRWVPGNPGGVAESIIGRWLKRSAVPRDQVIIATKVRHRMGEGPNDEGLSRAHILKAAEDSLRRLGTDYIDLYQMHAYDANTPIEETLAALDLLIQQGKVRYIGCSNYPAWRVMQALWAADKLSLPRFVSLQPHYNLVHRAEFERELREVAQEYRLGVLPYSPLARGFLSGKYRREKTDVESQRNVSEYFTERHWAVLDAVDQIARARGATPSQVALAWLLTQPVITSVVIGPRTLEQLRDNLGAAGMRLTPEEMETLNRVSASL